MRLSALTVAFLVAGGIGCDSSGNPGSSGTTSTGNGDNGDAGMMTGGFFNTTVGGSGTVAVTSVGKPVVFDCSLQPVFVDPNSAVMWSAGLVPAAHSSMNMSSVLRGGSGEAVQYVFHGPGFVVVQAYEWTATNQGVK